MKKVFALSLIAIVLTGCNTISGVGRDVQRAGQIVTGAGGK
ncbi:entericidin A/B family lipoprotein [Massilia sp. RP-1-19]|uniref:Type IV secretion system putative lipoprotein virB7 n=2 Tax=Massilia TaxID=149698 RepID=A0A848HRJ2_9BURK|nr:MULTISPECIES: entericidin A/B family lipoprotein [Massilia]MCC6071512.1 entericidin A/B family lipoprotein [Massilia agrisoli]NML62361.1 entericidin A/B family lipoprotein [Massilia polaris]